MSVSLSSSLPAVTANSARNSQFGWFLAIGATPEAVAVLNDQPVLFTILVVALVTVILQVVLLWYIHYATLKPEQKNKKKDAAAAKKGGDNDRKGAGTAAPAAPRALRK